MAVEKFIAHILIFEPAVTVDPRDPVLSATKPERLAYRTFATVQRQLRQGLGLPHEPDSVRPPALR